MKYVILIIRKYSTRIYNENVYNKKMFNWKAGSVLRVISVIFQRMELMRIWPTYKVEYNSL